VLSLHYFNCGRAAILEVGEFEAQFTLARMSLISKGGARSIHCAILFQSASGPMDYASKSSGGITEPFQ
jgi:hypothetical protein